MTKKNDDLHEPDAPMASVADGFKSPGRVRPVGVMGASSPPQVGDLGMAGLRRLLSLSEQASLDDVATTAIGEITDLRQKLQSARQVERFDARTQSAASQL